MSKKTRALKISNLARSSIELLEEDIDKISLQFKDSMEISHYLATLNNLLAIRIFMKFRGRPYAKKHP